MQNSNSKEKLKILELPSRYFDERREGSVIDTLIIHAMSNPLVKDVFSPYDCKKILDHYEVSAHYIIDRAGQIWRLVEESKRAWHAGVSKMPRTEDGREAVNHFSIGVELIANESSGYTEVQLESLLQLTIDLVNKYPIENIYGHSDIAPERKTDPWGFDWQNFMENLKKSIKSRQFHTPYTNSEL